MAIEWHCARSSIIRLLFVNSTRKWGGVKTWTLRVASSLQAVGHDLTIVGRRGDPFVEACQKEGLEACGLPFGASWSPLMIWRLVSLIRRKKIELVICNTGRDLSTAGMAAWICGIPVIHRIGSVFDFRDTWTRRTVHRLMVKAVLLPARWMEQELKLNFPWLRATPFIISHHGVPLDVKQAQPAGSDPLRVVICGRLHHEKGQLGLLKALSRITGNWELELIGEGDYRPVLEEWIQTHLADKTITLSGFCGDVPERLAKAQLAVIFSDHESISNVVLEYMAAGLPVIASDLAGIREVDPEGRALVFVSPGDIDGLSRELERLMADHAERQRRGSIAREIAEGFSRDHERKRLEYAISGLIVTHQQARG
jgi:glycosyltransferase involved in cell wall biosynthesis